MEYPKEFVEKVKAEYPNWKELHEKLERGDIRVGSHLAEKSNLGMGPDEIVKAFNEGRQEDVKKSAEQCVRRKKLLVKWWGIKASFLKKKLVANC